MKYIPCTCETFHSGSSRSPSASYSPSLAAASRRWWLARQPQLCDCGGSTPAVNLPANDCAAPLSQPASYQSGTLWWMPQRRILISDGSWIINCGNFSMKKTPKKKQTNRKTSCSSRVLPLPDLPEESRMIQDDQTTWGSVSFVCVYGFCEHNISPACA